jgi:UDP-glucuronate 4-epimerase
MRILVTGAAGFIGSALCKQLVLFDHELTAIDNFSSYYDVSLKHLRVKELLSPLNLEVLNLDICNQSEINTLIASNKPEVIIHLAAQAGVRLGVSESHKYVESNLVGFSNVLISAIENKIPRFLYASSSSVYGNSASIPYTENEKSLNPSSFYGATKLANELLVSTIIRNSSTIARGLRLFSVYGPWGRPDMAYFRIIASALTGSKFNLFGDGSVERDFTYIDDVVSLIINLTEELEKHSFGFADVVNLGGGKPVSINKLLEVVESISNKPINCSKEQSHSGDMKKTMSNPVYLNHLTQARQFTHLTEGVKRVINWANQDAIKSNLENWVS